MFPQNDRSERVGLFAWLTALAAWFTESRPIATYLDDLTSDWRREIRPDDDLTRGGEIDLTDDALLQALMA